MENCYIKIQKKIYKNTKILIPPIRFNSQASLLLFPTLENENVLPCDFFGSCVLNLVLRAGVVLCLDTIPMTVHASFIFKKNTALGTRLRNPNEKRSLVANAKLTETIMAKSWALFN